MTKIVNPSDSYDQYRQKDRQKKLEEFIETVVEIAGTYKTAHEEASVYQRSGLIHYAQGEFIEAIKDFDTALQFDTSAHSIYNDRGNAYYALGKYTEALSDYKKAIKIHHSFAKVGYCNAYDHRCPAYFFNAGNAFYAQGKFSDAICNYQEAIINDYDKKDKLLHIQFMRFCNISSSLPILENEDIGYEVKRDDAIKKFILDFMEDPQLDSAQDKKKYALEKIKDFRNVVAIPMLRQGLNKKTLLGGLFWEGISNNYSDCFHLKNNNILKEISSELNERTYNTAEPWRVRSTWGFHKPKPNDNASIYDNERVLNDVTFKL